LSTWLNQPKWVDEEIVRLLIGDENEQTKKARAYITNQLDTVDVKFLNNLVSIGMII